MLTGALNFRDLGGLPTQDGRRTVPGALFRSDALEELTPADVDVLCDELGVCDVIDLRATLETGGGPPAWAIGRDLAFVSLPLSDTWAQWGELDDEGRRTLMARKYINYLDDAGENVIAALRRIAANAGKPTLFHCAVGKDRTGVLAAILLSVLHVPREEIVRDYYRTAEAMEPLLARLTANPVYAERVRTNPAEVYRAEEHTMWLFLEMLDERDGGPEAWALARGLEPEVAEALRKTLTEPDPAAARS